MFHFVTAVEWGKQCLWILSLPSNELSSLIFSKIICHSLSNNRRAIKLWIWSFSVSWAASTKKSGLRLRRRNLSSLEPLELHFCPLAVAWLAVLQTVLSGYEMVFILSHLRDGPVGNESGLFIWHVPPAARSGARSSSMCVSCSLH